MPAPLIAILTLIINNPELILQGEQAIASLVQDAIDIWRRWQAGTMTEAQRDAAWQEAGVDMAAVRDHWRQRHPIVKPT